MKLPLFSLAIILLIPFISTSQTLSDIPPFEITKPKWQYYTYDYYFPQNPRTPEDTPYGNRFIEKTVEKGDFFLYIRTYSHLFERIFGLGWFSVDKAE